jgi:hypothetical protein
MLREWQKSGETQKRTKERDGRAKLEHSDGSKRQK